MPFIAAPNICMVEIRASFAGQQIENRIFVDTLAPTTLASCHDCAQTVLDWAEAEYFPNLPSQISLTEVVGTGQDTSTSPQSVVVPASPVVGGDAAGAMPNEVTFCLKLGTGNRGRSARGRLYILGMARDKVTDNLVDPGYMAGMLTHFQGLRTDITALGFLWTIVSYRNGGVVRPGGPVYFPVTELSFTDNIVDSMRRRKPGVGS